MLDAFADLDLIVEPEARGRGASKVHIENMKCALCHDSLNTFKRCFMVRAHDIFDKMPEHIVQLGLARGWTHGGGLSAMKEGQKYLAPRLVGEKVFKSKKERKQH